MDSVHIGLDTNCPLDTFVGGWARENEYSTAILRFDFTNHTRPIKIYPVALPKLVKTSLTENIFCGYRE